MKVELEKVRIGASPITDEVFVGITNKSGNLWLKKVNATNQFYDAVLSHFLGDARKTERILKTGSSEFKITVERIKQIKQ